MKMLKYLTETKKLSKKEQQSITGGGVQLPKNRIECRVWCPKGESCTTYDPNHCYPDGTGA